MKRLDHVQRAVAGKGGVCREKEAGGGGGGAIGGNRCATSANSVVAVLLREGQDARSQGTVGDA